MIKKNKINQAARVLDQQRLHSILKQIASFVVKSQKTKMRISVNAKH